MASKYDADITNAIAQSQSLVNMIINLVHEVDDLKVRFAEIQPILVRLAKLRAAEVQPESMEEYEKDEVVQLYKRLLTLVKIN